jgi:hypothetical protein
MLNIEPLSAGEEPNRSCLFSGVSPVVCWLKWFSMYQRYGMLLLHTV